jgi:hypothetical protein
LGISPSLLREIDRTAQNKTNNRFICQESGRFEAVMLLARKAASRLREQTPARTCRRELAGASLVRHLAASGARRSGRRALRRRTARP